MSVFTVADLQLWSRCHRQWVERALTRDERWPIMPIEMIGVANLRETGRVVAMGTTLFGEKNRDLTPKTAVERGIPAIAWVLDAVRRPDETKDWSERTRGCIDAGTSFNNGLVIAHDLVVGIDRAHFRERAGGWEIFLYRAGTGIRGVFEEEAAALNYVLREQDIPIAGLYISYLDKSVRFSDSGSPDAWRALFRESNVTGRAGKMLRKIPEDLREMRDTAEGTAVIPEDYRCRSGCRLCAPKEERVDGRYDVLTLHKGRHIGRELQNRGVFDLREIDPTTCRLSQRQMIQIAAVRSDTLHVDHDRLQYFLAALKWPLFFLDFEAYSQSIPPMKGLVPYEHAPVIASLDRQENAGAEPENETFVACPGKDQREEFFNWLEDNVAVDGTIVVFSKPFESAMIRQLASAAEKQDAGEMLVSRMVDLLMPFSDFILYHPDQRGKVSLKRVLPIYTGNSYDEVTVRDGMHANLSYTRLADRSIAGEGIPGRGALAAEGVSRFLAADAPRDLPSIASLEDITRYCATDTRALVVLIEKLRELARVNKTCST